MPVEIEFELSEQDYREALRDFYLFYLRQKGMRVMVLLMAIAGVMGILAVSAFKEAIEEWLSVGLLVGFAFLVIGIPIMIVWYLPYQGARRISKKREKIWQRWKVTDSGVEVQTEHSESRSDWGMFEKVVESEKYYLLCLLASKTMFLIVPKRAFRTQQTEMEFREMLERHVGKA